MVSHIHIQRNIRRRSRSRRKMVKGEENGSCGCGAEWWLSYRRPGDLRRLMASVRMFNWVTISYSVCIAYGQVQGSDDVYVTGAPAG